MKTKAKCNGVLRAAWVKKRKDEDPKAAVLLKNRLVGQLSVALHQGAISGHAQVTRTLHPVKTTFTEVFRQ